MTKLVQLKADSVAVARATKWVDRELREGDVVLLAPYGYLWMVDMQEQFPAPPQAVENLKASDKWRVIVMFSPTGD
jgi:hypothetical protein